MNRRLLRPRLSWHGRCQFRVRLSIQLARFTPQIEAGVKLALGREQDLQVEIRYAEQVG